MKDTKNTREVETTLPVRIIDYYDNLNDQRIEISGGTITKLSGYTNSGGFYIAVAGIASAQATAAILSVKLMNCNNFISLPFYEGWNPLYVKQVAPTTGTTFQLYWGL